MGEAFEIWAPSKGVLFPVCSSDFFPSQPQAASSERVWEEPMCIPTLL